MAGNDYSQFFPADSSAGSGDYSRFFPVSKSPQMETTDRGYVPSERSFIPGPAPDQIKPTPDPSIGERLYGAGEAGLSLLTGATGGAVGFAGGTLGALAGAISTGKFRTPEEPNLAQNVALESARRFTYEPRSEAGRSMLNAAGEALAPMVAIPPIQAAQAGRMAGPAISQARGVANRVAGDVFNPQPAEIPGYGAAMASGPSLRQSRADALPAPLQLTKGQLTKDFDQIAFEREAAKAPWGGPLRERFADQNAKILQNFDEWIDQTGATSPELRVTGQVVTQAIADKAKAAKGKISAAYEQARASGETAQPVDVKPLLSYAESHKAEATNAPVISAFEQKLTGLTRGDGTISINDLEEVRKMVGTLSGKDATNAHFGKEIKTLIDGVTDGVGGENYQRARTLRARFANEFENVGVVDKLLSMKPGTKDRAVAYEDVFHHSILSGSLDDVRAIRKTLQTAGMNGEQAWKELQGQTVGYLKEVASQNAQRDIRGNPIVSFAGINKAVNNLDKDGKLDFIFGKNGAQQIRDIRDLSADVFTTPPGAVNTSNTSSAWWRLMSSLPGAKTVSVGKEMFDTRADRNKVNQALDPYSGMH